jgi:hypothetical protein
MAAELRVSAAAADQEACAPVDEDDYQPSPIEIGLAVFGNGTYEWLAEVPERIANLLDAFALELVGRAPCIDGESICFLPVPDSIHRKMKLPGWPGAGYVSPWPNGRGPVRDELSPAQPMTVAFRANGTGTSPWTEET